MGGVLKDVPRKVLKLGLMSGLATAGQACRLRVSESSKPMASRVEVGKGATPSRRDRRSDCQRETKTDGGGSGSDV